MYFETFLFYQIPSLPQVLGNRWQSVEKEDISRPFSKPFFPTRKVIHRADKVFVTKRLCFRSTLL
ncbi:MAG: hypothetical protein A3D59_03450 [Candidatus Wildermuthbacteria bacterium RIFCSPHIGHO2_02_FULL_47_17]|uniref:Uncharacterized protein n=1 Tax=Candidatus Wildermuthbacteria bacterium RIFCSPHIGHO2_02_FULL_47_17 TaxID=1802452 RepID=A0A1G2R4E6_9BACT|nr:MAG: hypothetical protein A3D59_03450 [Candidatus Wildermuthbacteria bacterium RIFCSPHIGHO2_02_FULL_47_17]